jgi:hypothetical protein
MADDAPVTLPAVDPSAGTGNWGDTVNAAIRTVEGRINGLRTDAGYIVVLESTETLSDVPVGTPTGALIVRKTS